MDLPLYVYIVFGLTVLSSIFLFVKATNYSKPVLILVIVWMLVQSILSVVGFYKNTDTIPPRVGLILFPALVVMLITFNNRKGKQFIDSLSIKALTLFHVIRIPIELVLYWLFVHKMLPELMTFEGRNFDILSGLTAPIVYYFGFIKESINKTILLAWNFLCLALLVNVVVNGLLSVPSVFQQFAFDQPNIAILQFPFVLLPSILVPLVLFAHLVSIRQLLYHKNNRR